MSDKADTVHVRVTIGANSLEVHVPPRDVSAIVDRWFAATGESAIQAQVEKLKKSASSLQSAVDANSPKPT